MKITLPVLDSTGLDMSIKKRIMSIPGSRLYGDLYDKAINFENYRNS